MPEVPEDLTRTAYDAVADVYADHFPGTEPEEPLELATIDHFTGLLSVPKRVLDAGCGAGRMLPYLAARGCVLEGIDLSPGMIRRAQHDHPQFAVRVGSLTEIDCPDGQFDGVFSWYSTIHNPDADLRRMLAEMARVTRPGGYVLVAFQSGQGMRRVGKGFQALGYDVVMNRYHRSLEQMVAAAEAQGLEVVARLERAPVSEPDSQAVLIAQRPAA